MSFEKNMRTISKPVDFKGIAGILGAGSRVYRGGVNNPVSGPRTIPGGFADQLRPVIDEKRGRPSKQSQFLPEVIQAYLMRRNNGSQVQR